MSNNDYRELLLGCGYRRTKELRLPSAVEIADYDPRYPAGPILGTEKYRTGLDFRCLTTLDINPDCKPDVLYDLRVLRHSQALSLPPDSQRLLGCQTLPFLDCYFDEIHAYEVLEHIGMQGDYLTLFAQFTTFHRILKPDGLFYGTCPSYKSLWAWGDPSHSRVITSGTLAFLSQRAYMEQVGRTSMTDFRGIYQADFEPLYIQENDDSLCFVLRAVKA